MLSVAQLIYDAAERPPLTQGRQGDCRVCGRVNTHGAAFKVPATFTDWDKLNPGAVICPACQFGMAERSAVLAARVGKEKPQCMRNYAHFVVAGVWIPLSKAHKTRQRELLLTCPEVAVVAISGQKHLILRARVGWWQIEEHTVRPFPRELAALSKVVAELYPAFNKTEIETGRYSHRRIIKFGVARWQELEQDIKPRRGTLVLRLAVFLVQKEKEQGEEKGEKNGLSGIGTKVVDPVVAGHTGGLQTPVRAEHLVAVRGQPARGGIHEQPARVRQPHLW